MSYKEQQSYDGSFNTPKYLFRYLDKFFNFKLDPCDSGNDWLGLPHSYNLGDNGLLKDWDHNTFVNPPYGKKNENLWIDKLREQRKEYRDNHYFILLPAKTESNWFTDLMIYSDLTLFLRPRVSFIKDGKVKYGNNIGSIVFGFRALNETGLEDLKKFVTYNTNMLNFRTDTDGYDHYNIFADLRVLKKKFQEIEVVTNPL